ncbi:hypothetical protein BZA77DRAFT_291956 [Pyronema omphalodes]|nr:hypothetical protein BZA77DRAFT_291956 [Pyronema omphalodes]
MCTLPYPTVPYPTVPCPDSLAHPTVPYPTSLHPTLPAYAPPRTRNSRLKTRVPNAHSPAYAISPYLTIPSYCTLLHLSFSALHYPPVSYPILLYPILPYPTLSYPILPYPTLSYPYTPDALPYP